MGFVNRKKSGRLMTGSKLIVPGQGILTAKNTADEKKNPKSNN